MGEVCKTSVDPTKSTSSVNSFRKKLDKNNSKSCQNSHTDIFQWENMIFKNMQRQMIKQITLNKINDITKTLLVTNHDFIFPLLSKDPESVN